MNKRNFNRLFDPGDIIISVSGRLYIHRDICVRECGSKISHVRHIIENIDAGNVMTMDAAAFRKLYNAAAWIMRYSAWYELQCRFRASYAAISERYL